MKNNKIDKEKLWNKIKLNSFYDMKSLDTLIIYNEDVSQQITAAGRKNLKRPQESLNNYVQKP